VDVPGWDWGTVHAVMRGEDTEGSQETGVRRQETGDRRQETGGSLGPDCPGQPNIRGAWLLIEQYGVWVLIIASYQYGLCGP